MCTINDVHCMPESPVNLAGVTKFDKKIEPKEEEFLEGKSIQTFTNHSVFVSNGVQRKKFNTPAVQHDDNAHEQWI